MGTNEILDQVRARLAGAFGSRLKGVLLFGSEARDEAEKATYEDTREAMNR